MNRVSTGELARINQEMAKAGVNAVKKRKEQEEQRKKYEEERQKIALEQSRMPNSGGSAWEQYRAAKAAGDVKNASEFIQKRDARNSAWNKVGADTLEDDMNALSKSIGAAYGDTLDTSKYYTQEQLNESSNQVKRVRDRLKALQDYYNTYGGTDEQKKAVDDQIKAYDSEIKFFGDAADYYGQFGSKEAYEKLYDDMLYPSKYAGKTYSGIQEAINSAKDEREKKWLEDNADSFMTSAEAQAKLDNLANEWGIKKIGGTYLVVNFSKLKAENPNYTKNDVRKYVNRYENEIKKLEALRDSAARREVVTNYKNQYSGEAKQFNDYLKSGYEKYYMNPDIPALENPFSGKHSLLDALDEDSQYENDWNIRSDMAQKRERERWEEITKHISENDKILQFDYADKNRSILDSASDAIKHGSNTRWRYLQDDEKQIYTYLLVNQGEEAADKFLKDMEIELDRRAASVSDTEIYGKIQLGNGWEALGYSLLSLPSRAVGNVSAFVDNVFRDIAGKPLNPYSDAQMPRRMSNVIRQAVTEKISNAVDDTWFDRKVFGQELLPLLYSTGMSVLDSQVGGKTLGKLYTLAMGMGASADETERMLKKGASDSQVVSRATAAGLAEILTEYFSIENLIKAKVPAKKLDIAKEILKQAGIEGSEEMASDVLNLVADSIIMADRSDMSEAIAQYEKGYVDEDGTYHEAVSHEEAEKLAWQDFFTDMFADGFAGSISGGMGATIPTIASYKYSKNRAASQISRIDPGTAEGLASNSRINDVSVLSDVSELLQNGNLEGARFTMDEGIAWYEFLNRYGERKYGKNQWAEARTSIDESIKKLKQIKKLVSKGNITAEQINEVLAKADKELSVPVDVTTKNNEKLYSLLAKGELSNKDIERNILKDRQTLAAFERLTGTKADGTTMSQKRASVRQTLDIIKNSTDTLKSAQSAIESGRTASEGRLNAVKILNDAIAANKAENSRLRNSETAKSKETKAAIDRNVREYSFLKTTMNYVRDGGDLSGFTDSPVANVSAETGTNTAGGETSSETAKETVTARPKNDGAVYASEDGDFIDADTLVRTSTSGSVKGAIEDAIDTVDQSIQNINDAVNMTAEEKETALNELARRKNSLRELADNVSNIDEMARLVHGTEIDKIAKELEKPLKKLGLKIEVENNIEGSGNQKSGAYFDEKTRTVHVSRNWGDVETAVHLVVGDDGNLTVNRGHAVSFDRAVTQTIAHEIAHGDPSLVRSFVNAVAGTRFDVFDFRNRLKHNDDSSWKSSNEKAQENWDSYRNAYLTHEMSRMSDSMTDEAKLAAAEKKVNNDYIYAEIMSDYFGQAIDTIDKNGSAGDNIFVAMNRTQPNVLRRILNAVKRFIARLGGKDNYLAEVQRQQAERLERLITKALGRMTGTEIKKGTSVSEDASIIENGGTVTDADGNIVAESNGNGGAVFSLSTYEQSGRNTLEKFLDKQVKKKELSSADADDIMNSMEEIYNVCKNYEDKYTPFGSWSEAKVVIDEATGRPVFSVVKQNGDYAMNLDFSVVCKKRRALDAVLNRLVETGAINNVNLGQEEIVRINELIRDHGFEIACDLCFVDAKRYRQESVAQDFVDLYNDLVKSMAKEGQEIDYFNFGKDTSLPHTDSGINRLKNADLDFSKINETLAEGGKGTVPYKTALYLKNNPSGRKLLNKGDFMSSRGFDAIAKENPAVLSLFNSKKGSGGPKSTFSDVQYLNDIIKGQKFKREKAYDIGGVRLQSFSDYVPRLVFDYMQMVGDLAAKKLPVQCYTKEQLFVKQFGLTGMKINMSLIPALGDGTYAGLNADGSYAWGDQSFPVEEAYRIQADPEYGKNCGTIAVGVSDEHIWKLLSDPNIRMVIPYHKSGINPIVAVKLKIGTYTNYTEEQNTRYADRFGKDGKPIKLNKEDAAKEPNFNTFMHRDGLNAIEASKKYVEWCEKNNYLPKFDRFVYTTDENGNRVFNENYYKVLEDFTTMVDGEYHPQGDVRMNFPDENSSFGSLSELIKEGLEEDAVTQNKLNAEVDSMTEDILDVLRKEASGKTEEISDSNVKWSLTEANDRYMKAVNDGDEKTAQRLVNEAARENGYSEENWYHGTRAFGFTEFDLNRMDDGRSIFLTNNPLVAESYSGTTEIRPISEKLRWTNKGKTDQEIVSKYNELFPHSERAKLATESDVENMRERYNRDIASDIEQLRILSNMYSTEGFKEYLKFSDEETAVLKKLADLYERSSEMSPKEVAEEYKRIIQDVKTGWNLNMFLPRGKGFANSARFLERLDNLSKSGNALVKIGDYIHDVRYVKESIEEAIDNSTRENAGNYKVFARLGNVLEVDAAGYSFDNLPLPKELKKYAPADHGIEFTTREIAEYAKEAGYDSVVFDGITDVGNDAYDYYESDVAVIFNPSDVKSADAITYDNDGNVIPLTERFDSGKSDIRWSLSGNYDYSKTFAEQIDDYKAGLFPSRDTLVVGETPRIWQDVGFNALPVTLNQTHVDYALNGTKDADHIIAETVLKMLPEEIAKPVAIIQSLSNPSRAVVIIEKQNTGGNIVTPIEVDGFGRTNNLTIDSNALTSIHGKKAAIKQLQTAIQNTINGKTELFYWDKKRSLTLLHSSGLQLSGVMPQDGFVHSIREPGSLVKPKMNNVTNSLQFKRWFGDWESKSKNVSKVVNRDGTPRIVYHYTDADIDAFDTSKSGSNQGRTHGDGIYVSSSPTAFSYAGKNRLELYASIKKPFEMELTKPQAERVYDKYFAPYHNDVDDTYRSHVIEKLQSRTRVFDYLTEAADNGNVRTSDILSELGYDGVHDGNEWVAFEPTQLKSATDNIGTFDKDNPKLNYSLVDDPQKSVKSLKKSNERLQQQIADLKQELKLTHGKKLSRDALLKNIQNLVESYGSTLKADVIYNDVTDLYDVVYNRIVDGKKLKSIDEIPNHVIEEKLDDIAGKIIDRAVERDTTYDEYAGLLKELKRTKIVVPMDNRSDAAVGYGSNNWAEFRKKNFGKVAFANEGTPIDSYYMELSERFPELFPDDITHPGEQAAQIVDVVDTIRDGLKREVPLYGREDTEVRDAIKSDILNMLKNTDRLVTFADKAEQRVQDARLAERMHYGSELAKLKRERAEKIAAIKEHYAEQTANRSENQRKTVATQQIVRKVNEFTSLLKRPTQKNHVTEAFRKPLLDFLGSLDIVSKEYTAKQKKEIAAGGQVTRDVNLARQRTFDEIQRILLEAERDAQRDAETSGNEVGETDVNAQEKKYIVDSGILSLMYEWNKNNYGKPLSEMSSEQLKELNTILNMTKSVMSNIKRIYDPTVGLAAKSDVIQDEMKMSRWKDRAERLPVLINTARGIGETLFRYPAMDAFRFYNLIDSPEFTKQLDSFRHAQDKFGTNVDTFLTMMEDAVGENGIPESWHGKKAKEVTLDLSNGKLRATPGQIMSLYLLLQQEDSRNCLLNDRGGAVIGAYTAKGKVTEQKGDKVKEKSVRVFNKQNDPLVLTNSDVSKISEAMTPEMLDCANKISKILSGKAAQLGNEVSMAMWGYKKYTTENYFPMRVYETGKPIVLDPKAEMNLLGLSLAKERTHYAGKPLVVEDIFDAVGRHLTNMAQYNAFAQVIDDARRMYTLRTGNGKSLKRLMIAQYGNKADNYYRKLLDDLSGAEITTAQGVEAFSDKLLSNYKAAAVAKNLSVVFKQPMSIFRAMPEFSSAGWKAWHSFKDASPTQVKAEMAEMLEHSGIAKLKNWGASENMTKKSFEELYNNTPKSWLKRKSEMLDSGAEFADMWTWSRLWRMSKAEIDATGKYTKGSKEYFNAVNDKFSQVIGKTQVVQSALDSSAAVQNNSLFSKFFYAFQNEPLKQFNYLSSCIDDAVRGKKGAKAKLAKVVGMSVVNAVMTASVSTFFSLLRGTLDRDDDDEMWDDVLKSIGSNAFLDLVSGGLAPIWQLVETAMSAVHSGAYGSTVERMDLASLTDLGGLLNKYFKSQSGGRPNLGMLQDIINVSSELFGWSAKNAIRDTKAFADRLILDTKVSPRLKYNYLKVWKDVELTDKSAVAKSYYSIVQDAVNRGKYSDYLYIKRDMIYHGYTDTKIRNAVSNSELMDDLYELKQKNPGSYEAKVNNIVDNVSDLSKTEGEEFRSIIESAVKKRERANGVMTDDEIKKQKYAELKKEIKERLVFLNDRQRAKLVKELLEKYSEYGFTEADIEKIRLDLVKGK